METAGCAVGWRFGSLCVVAKHCLCTFKFGAARRPRGIAGSAGYGASMNSIATDTA